MRVLLEHLRKADKEGGMTSLTACGIQTTIAKTPHQMFECGVNYNFSTKFWANVPSSDVFAESLSEANKAITKMLLPNAAQDLYELECELSDAARECPSRNWGRVQDIVAKLRREIT